MSDSGRRCGDGAVVADGHSRVRTAGLVRKPMAAFRSFAGQVRGATVAEPLDTQARTLWANKPTLTGRQMTGDAKPVW